jgi:hypothetical protein
MTVNRHIKEYQDYLDKTEAIDLDTTKSESLQMEK